MVRRSGMDSYAILDDSNVVVNILVGKPYDGKFIKLTGELKNAKIGDIIQDGEIVRPEPTALAIWKEKVRANQVNIGLAMKQANYLKNFMPIHTINYINNEERRRRESLHNVSKINAEKLHNEYEKLKREAPDGWTIDNDGNAVQK